MGLSSDHSSRKKNCQKKSDRDSFCIRAERSGERFSSFPLSYGYSGSLSLSRQPKFDWLFCKAKACRIAEDDRAKKGETEESAAAAAAASGSSGGGSKWQRRR